MKRKRILLVSILCIVVLCCGCSKLRITSGSGWIMKMEESELSKQETKLIALTQSSLFQEFYVPLAGREFWEQLTDQNQQFQDYAKDTIVFEEAAALTVLNAIADSWELELTEEELDLVDQASRAYMSYMSKETRQYTGANRRDVIRLISKYVRARNVIQLLADDVNLEVSDNEMRIMDIQIITVSDLETATQLKAQVDAGADFLSLAKQYSIHNTYEYSVGRGELNTALESVVFSMDTGAVSEVIPVENEYYIIKCVNDYNEQLSEQNRSKIQQQRIYDVWINTIGDFTTNRSLELNKRSWEKISMEIKTEAQNSTLFDIIEQYFPNFSF